MMMMMMMMMMDAVRMRWSLEARRRSAVLCHCCSAALLSLSSYYVALLAHRNKQAFSLADNSTCTQQQLGKSHTT